MDSACMKRMTGDNDQDGDGGHTVCQGREQLVLVLEQLGF